jgi:Yip1 domain
VTAPDAPSPPQPERPVRAGFSLPLDVVVAPGRAYLKIARTGEWLPAIVVVIALGLATAALALPAIVHIETLAAPGPRPTQAQLQAIRSEVMLELGYQAVFVPVLVAALTATTLTVAARFKDPQAPYIRYFSLAANCLVPTALGGLLHMIPVALRGPAMYPTWRALLLAVPDSLAVFASPGNERELEFLSRFDIFSAWAAVLIAFGFAAFSGVRFVWALVIAFALDFIFAMMFG